MRHVLLLTAALTVAFPLPGATMPLPGQLDELSLAGDALSATPKSPDPDRSPWIATAISAAVPVAIGGLAVGIGASNPSAAEATAYTIPLGLGAGYVYGRDPLRGLAVGLGTYVVYLGVPWVLTGQNPFETRSPFAALYPAFIGLGALAIYTGWALFDVHQTTERRNDELKGDSPHGPPASVGSGR